MPPTVYPTGTTIYYPEKCWNGYTLFSLHESGTVLVDMNGRVMKLWKTATSAPAKMLPGGVLMGSTGLRDTRYGFLESTDLVQMDWNERITWKFDRYEYISDPDLKPAWMVRQHHDYQRDGNPVGYYVPGMDAAGDKGSTLILCHQDVTNQKISDKPLLDDTFIEVDWQGNIVWEWRCSDHFDEMGFSTDAKSALYKNPNIVNVGGGIGDWMHVNSMSRIGPNRWYDSGDQRFHPDNIIWDARETNIIAITDRKTGNIVWRLGPDYIGDTYEKVGQIIGQHHAHIIPRGLPGEGNVLVFDNGGWAGFGPPNPGAVTGVKNAVRDYSRVLEFNPVTLKIEWQYTAGNAGFPMPIGAYNFYSPLVSSAQRLPNGNTLITEGMTGRIFEVTAAYELVWEYVSPYFIKFMNLNMLYRAYRVPYEYVPQLKRLRHKEIPRINNAIFTVPDSSRARRNKATIGIPEEEKVNPQFCVMPEYKNQSKE